MYKIYLSDNVVLTNWQNNCLALYAGLKIILM